MEGGAKENRKCATFYSLPVGMVLSLNQIQWKSEKAFGFASADSETKISINQKHFQT